MKAPAINKEPSITVTESQMAKAFTEWDRRYREDPEQFMSEACRLLKSDPATYGDACAPYFLSILNTQSPPSV